MQEHLNESKHVPCIAEGKASTAGTERGWDPAKTPVKSWAGWASDTGKGENSAPWRSQKPEGR